MLILPDCLAKPYPYCGSSYLVCGNFFGFKVQKCPFSGIFNVSVIKLKKFAEKLHGIGLIVLEYRSSKEVFRHMLSHAKPCLVAIASILAYFWI